MRRLLMIPFLLVNSPALAGWEVQNPEQLETAIRAAFPGLPSSNDPCSAYTSIGTLTCKINPLDAEDIDCLAELTTPAGNVRIPSKDKKLIEALRISEISFAKQAEFLGLNCSRTNPNPTACPNNPSKVTCRLESWGGN